MNLLYIAVGGALGAVLRYLAGNAAVKYFNPQLPELLLLTSAAAF